jgi:hypothetical protein
MHATPTGPTENVPQKIPILHPHQIINRPKKSALAVLWVSQNQLAMEETALVGGQFA